MNLQAWFFFNFSYHHCNSQSEKLNIKAELTSYIHHEGLIGILFFVTWLNYHACWHRVKRVSWRSGLDHFGHNHNYYAHGCLAKSNFMSSWEMPSCCHHFLLGPEGCWVSWRPGGLSIKACSVMEEEYQPP